MVGNDENILVEFDYNNISIIDPNKVIDENGRAKERLVKQENLVMYANLECDVLPRTRLAVGTANNVDVQTISIAKMNFLNPQGKTFLDNSYTDEITGKNTLKGEGVNQVKLNRSNKSDDFFIRQTISSNGKSNPTDNGLLGITSISIKQNTAFNPSIEIELEDVKGRALFEAGDSSPYAAFFNLPYPLFHLTIKGFYGKAVRLKIMLKDFQTRYDASTGNFKVSLKFYTYKYTVLADISMGYLVATPHMFTSTIKIPEKSGGSSKTTPVKDTRFEIGFLKIKELYSEYKSKGLIPDDFPEITLVQMQQRLENFIKNVLDEFTKQNLDPITDIQIYQNQLNDYRKDVYYARGESWFYKYLDTVNYFVLKDGRKVYGFNTVTSSSLQKQETAISELKSYILEYNKLLSENKTVGINGSYTINNNTTKSSIPVDITYDKFQPKIGQNDIDWKETYRQVKGSGEFNSTKEVELIKEYVTKNLFSTGININSKGNQTTKTNYFVFEGTGTFIDITDNIGKSLKTIRENIESELSEALKILLESPNSGIGFVPSIRNVLAVIFANGEAFLRLLNDTHKEAWDQRLEDVRKKAIFTTNTSNANSDNLASGYDKEIPIYPWPQYIVETTGDKGQEKYEISYPGDPKYINQTKGFLFDKWPEVEFLEEFIKGYTQRTLPPSDTTATSNGEDEINRLSLNAIEFPITNAVFSNKELVKFFYEIWERLFFISNYSKLSRCQKSTTYTDIIVSSISEAETTNLQKSLSYDNPFIIQKLKENNFNASNFLTILRQFSNDGTGQSWQNLIRGIFNTSYIKNLANNANFQFLNQNVLNQVNSQPLVSLTNENQVVNFISNSTESNYFDLTDTYPFIDLNWDKSNLANGNSVQKAEDSFNTTKTLTFDRSKKVISSFSENTNTFEKRPISNFNYYSVETPKLSNYKDDNLKTFYENRSNNFKKQLPTEGNLRYSNYVGNLSSDQTTSILNTPIFVNSIQEGVKEFQSFNQYPFVASAYLFINSLPLSTTKEKFKTFNETNESTVDLDYIYATLKKFGGIHKMPYAWILKIGSVYHRYKNYIEKNVDILDSSWKNFDYVTNYDPISNDATKIYDLTFNNNNIDIILEKSTTPNDTLINSGFYPKLINDFNLFYQGYYIFENTYTSTDIQNGFNSGLTLNYADTAIINYNFSTTTINIVPWSVTVKTFDNQFMFVMPSQGSLINQTKNECFKNIVPEVNMTLDIPVLGNKSMYDGSVRLFWPSPNYGYFNLNNVSKPTPYEYIKYVFTGQSDQENYSINGGEYSYSNISEIFSIFDKNVLDGFEQEFLNFSKTIYDYDLASLPDNTTEEEQSYRNFQMLFRKLMKIPVVNGNIGSNIIEEIQNKQNENFQNIITGFLKYDVVFKYGNPSNFEKRLFYTFSNKEIVDPYTLDSYTTLTPDSLPPAITLNQSKTQYPQTWKDLEVYIGFSNISELQYKNSGSYITDFFIDYDVAFTSDNIKLFAPIIKIYATQKLIDNTLNKTKFINLMNQYIDSDNEFQNKITNDLFVRIVKKLPQGQTSPESIIDSKLEGPQTKVELWETFKAINDKWIAGNDFANNTLFEDILLMDRANRDIGDKILVDVFKLKDRLTNIPEKASMLSFVQSIIIENNFVIMNIPSYVNFYNVQEAVKNAIPKPEGTLELANTLFGTHLNVDYRNSSSKLVCLYAGKPSEHLDVKNVDYRYRNDAFELRRASDNPILENLIDKKDWAQSNKVVGFNVDIGPQNQSIFYGFYVDQRGGTPTAEGLEVLNRMANQGGNRGGTTQSTSLYNLYKNRSYNCTISMMGNAMIQPTMYFNLRNVPMFSGPYLILAVDHNINPGSFETIVTGVRQPIYSLPKIDSYLQSLKTNLLQSILTKDKQDKQSTQTATQTNIIGQNTTSVSSITNPGSNTVNTLQTCQVDTKYEKYTTIATPTMSKATFAEVVNKIKSKTSNDKVRKAIFARMYVNSKTSSGLINRENNYAGIPINQYWGTSLDSYTTKKQYWCSSSNIPYVVFDSLDKNIEFLVSRWSNRLNNYEVNPKDITKFLVLNQNAEQTQENVYQSISTQNITEMETIVAESIKIFNSIQ
jgi:hypothetical protein